MEKSSPPMRWVSAAVFVVVFLVNVLLMPAEFMRGDPLVWFSEAQSIVFRGELALEDGAIKYGQPGQYVIHNERNGRTYSKYGLMSSIAVIPAVLGGAVLDEAGTAPMLATNLWYALASAGLAVLLFQLAGRYTPGIAARLLFVVGCLYCSFLWYYLRAQGMELFICICALVWYRAMVGLGDAAPPTRRGIIVAWLMAAALVHTRPMFIVLAGLTAAWISWHVVREKAPGPALRVVVSAILPLVLLAVSLCVTNHVRFGEWYYTGYHQWNPEEHTASLGNLAAGLFGFIADPQYSVLLTFPPLLLSLFAARRYWQNHRRDYVLGLILCIGGMLFYSLFPNWRGEWSAGPRYVLFALLPASLPCAVLLADLMQNLRSWEGRLRLLSVCLVLAGSCFCWYQVIARSIPAWYSAAQGMDGYASVGSARDYLMPPRGLLLLSLDRPVSEFEQHPLMVQARNTMPAEQYARYRRLVYSEVQANNFYLFRKSGAQQLPQQEAR